MSLVWHVVHLYAYCLYKEAKPALKNVRRNEDLMEISLIFKIAAVGILVSVISQVLKHSGREEQAFLASLAGLLIVLLWIIPYIYDLFEMIKKLFSL